MALEECVGKPTGYPDQTGQRFLRAVNIETGEMRWEVPQPGPARAKTWSGVLATAGGLVFYGNMQGELKAVDARTGDELYILYQQRFGITIARAQERLRAVAADKLDARSLAVAEGSPLLEIDRVALSLDGNPVEWRLSRCNSAHHHYYSEIE